MANRKIKIYGHNHDAGTEATVTLGGVQVHSGAVSASVVSDADVIDETENPEPVVLFDFTYDNSDDSQLTEHALNISVTAGELRAGQIKIEATSDASVWNALSTDAKRDSGINEIAIDGTYYYEPGNGHAYTGYVQSNTKGTIAWDTAIPERKNILINGATPVTTGYEGTTYTGMEFVVGSGDQYTCTVRIPAALT